MVRVLLRGACRARGGVVVRVLHAAPGVAGGAPGARHTRAESRAYGTRYHMRTLHMRARNLLNREREINL